MPLPSPRKGERLKDFIQRGMASDVMKREFPNQKQRLAVLYDIARKKRGESRVPEPKKSD